MIFDFDPNIPDYKDFQRKYNGTYVLYKGNPAQILVNSENVAVVGGVDTEACVLAPNSSGVEAGLAPWLPAGGWVYGQKGLLFYVRQMPARQWRRSYCCDNYSLVVPYQHIIRGINVEALPVIQQLFKPAKRVALTPDFPSKIADKYSGGIIDDTYAISRYEESTWALITPHGVVGFINPEKNTIFVAGISHQEVLDLTKGVHQWTIQSI